MGAATPIPNLLSIYPYPNDPVEVDEPLTLFFNTVNWSAPPTCKNIPLVDASSLSAYIVK